VRVRGQDLVRRPVNREVRKVAQTWPKGVLHIDLVVADQVDKPPTNARHRMGVWWVEVVGIGPTTGVGRIGHQVPRIFYRFPRQLFIRQTTTSRGQALAGFAPQPLEQNHGVTGAQLVIGIHRRDGRRLPPPASPDTPARFATAELAKRGTQAPGLAGSARKRTGERDVPRILLSRVERLRCATSTVSFESPNDQRITGEPMAKGSVGTESKKADPY
jgi:hypothetical protein